MSRCLVIVVDNLSEEMMSQCCGCVVSICHRLSVQILPKRIYLFIYLYYLQFKITLQSAQKLIIQSVYRQMQVWVLMMCLMGTYDLSHGYCGCTSWVLMVFCSGTEDPHGYSRYALQVLIVYLTCTEILFEYCISSQVLKIVYTE